MQAKTKRKVTRHSDETRAAVLAALLAGQGVSEVARKYNIDKSIVSRWKKAGPRIPLRQVTTEKVDEFGDLLANYLREALESIAFLAKFIRTPQGLAWLQQQSAAELATLQGVTADKCIRLLAAAQQAEEQGGELAPTSGPADPSI